jgi:hypothetical protein
MFELRSHKSTSGVVNMPVRMQFTHISMSAVFLGAIVCCSLPAYSQMSSPAVAPGVGGQPHVPGKMFKKMRMHAHGMPGMAGMSGMPSDAPLISSANIAMLEKENPSAASQIKAAIASGKLPANLSTATVEAELSKVPAAERTQIIAALKAEGFQVSAAPTSVAPPSKNPFEPAYSVKEIEANLPSVSSFVSFVNLSVIKPQTSKTIYKSIGPNPMPIDVALGRVSGIILSGGVHAIYESQGVSSIVQPGDALPDGAGRVVAIDPTGIIVRVSGDQYVKVEVTANDTTQNQGQYPGQYPGQGGAPQGFGQPGAGQPGFGQQGFGQNYPGADNNN